MFKKDYRKLYLLQDKVLQFWATLNYPFYLTGGTALGRFYLSHRYSEDLDFFTNNDTGFTKHVTSIIDAFKAAFQIEKSKILSTDEFARFFIEVDDTFLKVELVNDVAYRAGNSLKSKLGLIDNPLNILSNKLSAIIGRDEPKDIFDIVWLANSYSFNWIEVFKHTKEKLLVNEIEIEQRLHSFPVQSLENVDWLNDKLNIEIFNKQIKQISDDFMLGRNNSLGESKPSIDKARLII
jgi:predicted nucleotidyltransferase component of viral defense system